MCWTRLSTKNVQGNHDFSGRLLITAAVRTQLLLDEVFEIYHDLKSAAEEHDGIDGLQIYQNSFGDQVHIVDQLSRSDILSGRFTNQDHVCVLKLPHE